MAVSFLTHQVKRRCRRFDFREHVIGQLIIKPLPSKRWSLISTTKEGCIWKIRKPAVDYPELKDSPDAQKIVLTHKDGKTRDLIVANASQNDIALDKGFYQKGLLSVIRQSDSEKMPAFLFLSGMYKFDYKDWGILAYAKAVNISIERTEQGYVIQNDHPVAVKIPFYEGHEPVQLDFYENDKLIEQRPIFVNRNNEAQVDFRLDKAYGKVVVVLKK